MPISQRPLTKIMIEKLRDCHDKQSKNGGNPCLQEDLKGSLAALYKRGLVDTKIQDVNGKRLLCIIVTESGVTYLKSLEKK
ncbi:MAG: hypothetical protein JWO92_161 [Chitinophagaceae bacterium]|nr:hypothetical protein [Chitinophagaceae bacterium]MDB5221511.1 hypothetical protein [Chitinophagaceae bacterium]